MYLAKGETHVVCVVLKSQRLVVAIGVQFRSLVGRHLLTDIYRHGCDSAACSSFGDGSGTCERAWSAVDALSLQLMMLQELFAAAPDSEERLELVARVVESHRAMGQYVRYPRSNPTGGAPRARRTFIESEQSTIWGHWLHPTPKSRQGFHVWQHAHYAPELSGRFRLHFFAAHRRWVRQASLVDRTAEELVHQIACHGSERARYEQHVRGLGDEYCLLPLHPLQAQWVLHQDFALSWLRDGQLLDLGPLGAQFTPTSSVRTLYCEALDYMVKVSIPVKITNSLRINLSSELGDSVWLSKLFRECPLRDEFPRLSILEDPAYITLEVPGKKESGFEVIFRSNPFVFEGEHATNRAAYSVAALTQDPRVGDGASVLSQLVQQLELHQLNVEQVEVDQLKVDQLDRARQNSEQAARAWFDAYFECAIQAPVLLYDRYGIALEAHQQNVLLAMDDEGLPSRCYYRDIQGVSLLLSRRGALVERVPELEQQPKVFEPDDVVQDGFAYYLIFNQLFSVIHRMALDSLLSEEVLLEIVVRRFEDLRMQMEGPGKSVLDALLTQPLIACKANLLTRLEDMDELETENELGVYCEVVNPLVRVAGTREAGLAGVRRSPSGSSTASCERSDVEHGR